MKRGALALAVLGVAGLAHAASSRNPTEEAAVDKAVAAVDPTLVPTVHEGNDAMDRGDAKAAAKAYATVHEAAPHVTAITRRLGVAEAHAGDPKSGIQRCRQAVSEEPAAENHAALATTLLMEGSNDDVAEALVEAKRAARLAPQTEFAQATLCEAAALRGDGATLERCTGALQKIAPHAAETHLYAGLVLASHGDFDTAEAEIDAARAAGLSDALATATHEQIEHARPHTPLRLRIASIVATAFIGTLFVLFVLGMALGDAAGKSKSRLLRRAYSTVVLASALFYDVFAVLLGLLLLLVTALGVYLFVLMTTPPLWATIVAGVVAVYVLFAMVRASVAGVVTSEPGAPLDLGREAKLKRALDAVAKELGERRVDEVYVRPDASIVVSELGGVVGHLRKKSKRRLTIGVFALEGMSVRALQAIVAREMAQLRGQFGVAMVARARLDAIADRMTVRGVAVGANPAWWIVSGYRWIFAAISSAAVSLQETYIDEQAASLYGSRALLEGLRHLVRRDVELDSRTAAIVREAIDTSATPPATGTFEEAWADYRDDEKRIQALDEEGLVAPQKGEAWDLFRSRADIERSAQERLHALVDDELGIRAAAPSP